MKHRSLIFIEKPLFLVTNLFENQVNKKYWLPGNPECDHLSGDPDQVGSRLRIGYQIGEKEFVVFETVNENNLPEVHRSNYESKYGSFEIRSSFEDIKGVRTKWVADIEIQFKGIFRYLSFFIRKNIKERTYDIMNEFKTFVESR